MTNKGTNNWVLYVSDCCSEFFKHGKELFILHLAHQLILHIVDHLNIAIISQVHKKYV